MEERNQPPPFVTKADQNFVEVVSSSSESSAALESMGFMKVSDKSYHLPTITEVDKASVFNELRKLGFCFSRGREWNPAEVFEYLRDKGLIHGQFTEIAWTRPDQWRTRSA